MKVTFDTQNAKEVAEVKTLLGLLVPENNSKVGTASKETKSIPKPTPKPKKAPEPKKEVEITLADLKESAKNAVTRSSREEVKKTIGEFAEKLAEVAKADYDKLHEKLQELGA